MLTWRNVIIWTTYQILIFWCAAVLLACDKTESSRGEGVTDDEDGGGGDTVPTQLVLPLLPLYRNWDYHVFQGLDGHPRYEMVELMLDDTTSDTPLAWVFFTEREAPKKQFHYVNNAEYAAWLSDTASPDTRVVEVTPINVVWDDSSNGPLTFDVTLETSDGPAHWEVITSGPATDYSELIEQSGHDLPGGILLMYINQTVLISDETTLAVGDETWPATVWEEISNSSFTGYHGSVSPRLAQGYLPSHDDTVVLAALPERLDPGRSWTYIQNGFKSEWLITERSGGTLVVKNESEETFYTLELELDGSALRLQTISTENDGGEMAVRFIPSLPDLARLKPGAAGEAAFTIDIDGHTEVMAGEISLDAADDGRVTLLLTPQTPEWAVKNPMEISLSISETGYEYSIRTMPESE